VLSSLFGGSRLESAEFSRINQLPANQNKLADAGRTLIYSRAINIQMAGHNAAARNYCYYRSRLLLIHHSHKY